MKTSKESQHKENEYGTWPLVIFTFGLIAVMVILYYIKKYFFD